ncbi:MAG: hypothetical protein H7240_07425 [Glaciimonas sp.]|nr:hypothetical protein [Glaciimonas sp.]
MRLSIKPKLQKTTHRYQVPSLNVRLAQAINVPLDKTAFRSDSLNDVLQEGRKYQLDSNAHGMQRRHHIGPQVKGPQTTHLAALIFHTCMRRCTILPTSHPVSSTWIAALQDAYLPSTDIVLCHLQAGQHQSGL